MSEWVWFAGAERLNHLGLMRASAASRRFARLNVLLLAAGAALLQGNRVGWRWVAASPVAESPESAARTGLGWIHVASAPRPLPLGPTSEAPVDLWWNPVQALLGMVSGFVLAFIGLALLLRLVQLGATWVHPAPHRGEQRMTAAIHYGTAWFIPVFLAAPVAVLRTVAYFGEVQRWPWYPSREGFVLSAGVLGGFGAVLWWFWLVRVSATARARARGRVIAFVAVASPMIAAAAAAGWWLGLDRLHDPLFGWLNLVY